jgi:hypothetical protein
MHSQTRRKKRIQMKRVNGKLRAGSVTSVIAPSPHDDQNLRLKMTSKADMEQACLVSSISSSSSSENAAATVAGAAVAMTAVGQAAELSAGDESPPCEALVRN